MISKETVHSYRDKIENFDKLQSVLYKMFMTLYGKTVLKIYFIAQK